MPKITAERLREVLNYDPETGLFTWKWRASARPMWNKRWPGKVAGTVNKITGYRHIIVDYVPCYAHRLAFLYMTGRMPRLVDHINRDKLDNRWANLRPASISENALNSKSRVNISGHRGVSWNAYSSSWQARIHKNNRVYHLGRFKQKEEAVRAYEKAAERLYRDFHRPSDHAN